MEFSSEKPKFPSNSSNIKYLRRKEVDLGPPSKTWKTPYLFWKFFRKWLPYNSSNMLKCINSLALALKIIWFGCIVSTYA